MTATPERETSTPALAASLGQQLRAARKRADLTQAELAAAAQVERKTVGRVERDPASANVDTLLRLLEALGARLDLS